MEIKLNTLSIQNFKGIKNEYFDFKNGSAEISGANASGKTSVYDALLWLLTGKNSEDVADFTIKPVDLSGNKIIGAIPEVKATFDINGQEVELSKRLEEVWKKKTGDVEKSYDSDTVNAFIDGIPRKIDREYNEYIKSLVGDETILKIGLYYDFFMNMHFKDKRNVLLSLTTSNPDEQLEKIERFRNINDILRNQSVEDTKKRLQEEKRRFKKEYDGIPERIDELRKTVVDINERDIKNAETQNQIIENNKSKIKKTIDDLIKNNSLETKKISEEIQSLFNQKLEYSNKQKDSLYKEKRLLTDELNMLEISNTNSLKSQKLNIEHNIENNNALLEKIRNSWKIEFNKEYEEKENTCPTCSQSYPKEFLKNRRDVFDSHKKTKLGSLEKEGKKMSDDIEKLKMDLNNIKTEIENTEKANIEIKNKINILKDKISVIDEEIANTDKDPKMLSYNSLIENLQLQLDNYNISDKINENESKIQNLIKEQDELKEVFVKAKTMESTKSRIIELENEYKRVGKELLQIDTNIQLIEDYNSERCKLLEDEINNHFNTIKWKLFEIQKNGGIKDVCTATVDGVDYTDLNNAARINAGIETSNIITKINNVRIPMFVDNAESIIDAMDTGWQMIFLTVSKDRKLKFKALDNGLRTWGLN